ncbi:hypothetical protein K5D34_06360 [Pseudomonas cichorii]|uniref:hypothetical protein n=1 Tax=Pseudomonas cichorii TaxID=36746 RepID=UPI0018E5EADB|nr:hypothetical protein [Pseudomonas cichorii]MBI6854472.1 hypothetical protein [Pseudomonas cichorii]MBX8489550.1 hypothetical protein [Pseudomonas cichorii]MBX8509314.1 hypothetical protein [Pseudomonas cichorii]MBX8524173.1 hypothetical protein [Pseudomonas cichorii]MBX8541539.1 hypothetical protein [Pseudomonas cichorii]
MGNTILIEVLPDFYSIETFIPRIKKPIFITVQIGQGLKTITGFVTIRHDTINTKQLCATINNIVAIQIHDEQTVITTDPACACFILVPVVIEYNADITGDGFNTITI